MSKNRRKKRAASQLDAPQQSNTTNGTRIPTAPRAMPEKGGKGIQRPPGEGLSKTARKARNRRLRAEAAAKAQLSSTVNVKVENEPGVKISTLSWAPNQPSAYSTGSNGRVSGTTPYPPSLNTPTCSVNETRALFSFPESSKPQDFESHAAIIGENLLSRPGHRTSKDTQSNKTLNGAIISTGKFE
jgi:hypothetical protein